MKDVGKYINVDPNFMINRKIIGRKYIKATNGLFIDVGIMSNFNFKHLYFLS